MADLIKTSLLACFEKKSTLKINCWNLNVHKIKLQKSKLQKFKVHGIEMALNKNGMLTLFAFLCREEREIMGN